MSFDEEKDNSYAKFTNPISMMDSDDDMQKSVDFPQYTESEDPTSGVKARKVFTEEEVADLQFAFEVCCEFSNEKAEDPVLGVDAMLAMLRALGTDIEDDEVYPLVREAKQSLARNQAREKRIREAVEKGKILKVPFKGIFSKVNTYTTSADQVNFSEFFLLMTNDEMVPHLPNGEWVTAAHHVRILHNAFKLTDTNGDGELEFEELNSCINNLHSGNLGATDIRSIWNIMNPDKKPFIVFVEFVEGMEKIIKHPVFGEKFNLFGHNFLLSMIIDTPVSEAEERKIMHSFGLLERLGMSAAKRSTEEWTVEHRKEVMAKAEQRVTHILTADQQERLGGLHRKNVLLGFLIGLASATTSACWETWVGWELDTDGVASHYNCIPDSVGQNPKCIEGRVCGCMGSDAMWAWQLWHGKNATVNATHTMRSFVDSNGDPTTGSQTCSYFESVDGDCEWLLRWDEHPYFPLCDWKFPDINTIDPDTGEAELELIKAGECEMTAPNVVVMFWVLNGGVLILCCVIEILMLYWYSIKNAVNVAGALDLVLMPVNRDRAFVCNSLVRAALELGPDNEPIYGVDPMVLRSGKGDCMEKLFKGLYMAKIVLSGFLLKIVLKRLVGRVAAKGYLAFMAIPATSAWNALVAHTVMREAKLRGLGISTSVEVFQEIMYDLNEDLTSASDAVKIQVARAIGCQIASAYSMYSAKGRQAYTHSRRASIVQPRERTLNPNQWRSVAPIRQCR